MGIPQVVGIVNLISFAMTLRTSPSGMGPLLDARFTHDRVVRVSSTSALRLQMTPPSRSHLQKYKAGYREEVSILATWCQDNTLSLNIWKTKEMIVDH